MLLQFSVKNFKTFKEKATLSLIASNYDKNIREDENVYHNEKFNLRILKSAVMYGANGSGKSKLIEALLFMKEFVEGSSILSQLGDKIKVQPFLLNSATESQPSEFEAIFLYNDTIFRYGFEASKDNVIAEWFYYKRNTKEVELFNREMGKVETHNRDFSKGRAVANQGLVRDNALLVSVAAQFNEDNAIMLMKCFKDLYGISGNWDGGYKGFTLGKIKDNSQRLKILELLNVADFGILDLEIKMVDEHNIPEEMPAELREIVLKKMREGKSEFASDVIMSRNKYDAKNRIKGHVNLSLENDESSGTKQFFALTGPILDVLENGHVLIVDELDSKLHPNLVCKLINLFNSSKINKKNAQLIFNTHDTNLLSSGLFRRDQVWFVEKNKYGEAQLYSLGDFKSDKVRINEPFEDNYIRGKYGAVPYLALFDNLENILVSNENAK